MTAGRAVHTLTFRLDNATNELYRNHLSFIKDLVPEMGRSVNPTSTVRRAISARSVGKSFVFNAAFQNCLNSD
jgi:hypothetical protein